MEFNARVEQVIITELTLRGTGEKGDPYRRITEIWGFDGNKIAEVDPIADKQMDNASTPTD